MPEGSAIQDILQMRQQGLSNNQIIQNLQRQGYSNTQIFDAMNQADAKVAVEGLQPPQLQPPMQHSSGNGQMTQMKPPQQVQPSQHQQQSQQHQMPQHQAPQGHPTQNQAHQHSEHKESIPPPPHEAKRAMPAHPAPSMHHGTTVQVDEEKIEELIEVMIEEKWTELIKDVNKIVAWKNKIESQIAEIEIKLSQVSDRTSDLNKSIVSKVNDYDKHILEVGANLKAMERAFTKVLPSFTEHVHELGRISQSLKEVE